MTHLPAPHHHPVTGRPVASATDAAAGHDAAAGQDAAGRRATAGLNRRRFLAGTLTAAAALAAACSGGNTGRTPAAGGGGAGASAGGGGTSGSKANITWSTWGSADELKRVQAFTDEFNKTSKLANATLQPVPAYSDYHPKLLTQLVSGTAADVFYVGDDNIGKFVTSKVMLPLQDRLDGSASQSKTSDFAASLFGVAKQGDTIWAAPNDCNPDLFWYDKSALKAAGITDDPADMAAKGTWTTDALIEMCTKLKAAGLHGAAFWNYWATHWSWVRAAGGTVYDDAGAFVLPDDKTSVQALGQLGKAFKDGIFDVADELPSGSELDALIATGKIGFAVQGRYTIAAIQQSDNPDNFDVAPWPSSTGKPPSSGVALSYLAINAKTPNPDAAFEFFTAFVSAAGQTFRLQEGGNAVPSIKGADKVVLDGFPPHAQTMLDARDTGFVDFPAESMVPGLSSDISTAMLGLYQGKTDVNATVAAISKLVTDKGK